MSSNDTSRLHPETVQALVLSHRLREMQQDRFESNTTNLYADDLRDEFERAEAHSPTPRSLKELAAEALQLEACLPELPPNAKMEIGFWVEISLPRGDSQSEPIQVHWRRSGKLQQHAGPRNLITSREVVRQGGPDVRFATTEDFRAAVLAAIEVAANPLLEIEMYIRRIVLADDTMRQETEDSLDFIDVQRQRLVEAFKRYQASGGEMTWGALKEKLAAGVLKHLEET